MLNPQYSSITWIDRGIHIKSNTIATNIVAVVKKNTGSLYISQSLAGYDTTHHNTCCMAWSLCESGIQTQCGALYLVLNWCMSPMNFLNIVNNTHCSRVAGSTASLAGKSVATEMWVTQKKVVVGAQQSRTSRRYRIIESFVSISFCIMYMYVYYIILYYIYYIYIM